ncbi:hypothetical protein ACOSQ3_016301 [Xanthoceras sorbifolium]
MDKEWLRFSRVSQEYRDGARNFVEAAQKHSRNPDMIPCPCIKCINHRWHPTKIVYEHLVIYRMDPTYTNWVFHGENLINFTPIEKISTTFRMYKDANTEYHDNIEPDVKKGDEDLTHIVEDVDIPL